MKHLFCIGNYNAYFALSILSYYTVAEIYIETECQFVPF